MAQSDWSEDFSVHIPQFDAQHRQVFELLNELRGLAHGGENGQDPAALLQKVHRYGEWHLQREELMLRIRAYPGYEAHKAEHDVYRKKVAELEAQSDRRDIVIRIANFLSEWWRYHILTSDQQYARFFQRQATLPGGAVEP